MKIIRNCEKKTVEQRMYAFFDMTEDEAIKWAEDHGKSRDLREGQEI